MPLPDDDDDDDLDDFDGGPFITLIKEPDVNLDNVFRPGPRCGRKTWLEMVEPPIAAFAWQIKRAYKDRGETISATAIYSNFCAEIGARPCSFTTFKVFLMDDGTIHKEPPHVEAKKRKRS